MGTTVYQVVTDRIIAELEKGAAPWDKPWRSGEPSNMLSGKTYRGINTILLGMQGHSDPRWLTFKQATALGGTVRKAEHGTPIVFWKWNANEGDDHAEKRSAPILRYYTVFNVSQCDGLALPPLNVPTTESLPLAEAIISGYNGPAIRHGGDRAFYSPALDYVQLPDRATFEDAPGYYGTLFHELGHSTGHASRLARFPENAKLAAFGSADYSKEELIAELCAAMLLGVCRIESTIPRHAAYIASWLRVLRADSRMLVMAAAAAQRGTDTIRGVKLAHKDA